MGTEEAAANDANAGGRRHQVAAAIAPRTSGACSADGCESVRSRDSAGAAASGADDTIASRERYNAVGAREPADVPMQHYCTD